MSNNIDELYQAARYNVGACKNFSGTNSDLYKEFTKLIIEDAIKAIQDWKNEPFPFDEDTAVWILKQRFGVE